jgi:hypothetical protein
LAACAGLISIARPALAEDPPVSIRFAVHDHFDRLVFALPPDATFSSTVEGGTLKIRLTGAGKITGQFAPGQRLLGLDDQGGAISIHLAANTHPHVWQLNNRLVVDVDEATSPAPSVPGEGPAAAPVRVHALAARKLEPAGPVPAMSLAPIAPVVAENMTQAAADPPAAGASPPETAPQAAVSAPLSGAIEVAPPAAAASSRAAVTLLVQDASDKGPAFVVPFGADTGAAAFGRGGQGYVVFDTTRPADLGQLKDDPVFGGVTERMLPDGMVLRVPLPAGAKLLLARLAGGWSVTLVHDLPGQAQIGAHADHGVLTMQAAAPGHVVVLDDEATGGKLLVGTQRAGGQGMPAAHQSAEFIVLPSWQGVVVSPESDRIQLAPVREGFRLTASAGPKLSILWADQAGRVMTRHFDFPDLPEGVLQNRLTLARSDSAKTPRLARFPARLKLAQAMLAEGMDVEARVVLHAATSDDPAHADDADAAGLSAIANWLVARAGGAYPPLADTFNPAILGDSDEAQFWQALLKGGEPDVAAPAATLGVTWPLLQQYPADLQHRIAPAVADILGRGGQDKALAGFLAAFRDQSLDLARAELLKRQGKTDEALAWLDAVAKRPNRLMRASAEREAVEMRLAARKIDEAAAEAALSRQIYSWRGGPSDLALRLRVADLRIKTGHWRPALALLRETDGVFPEAHAQIQAAESRLIADLLRGDRATQLSALDLVALAEEAAPLLSAADADVTLAPVLVDKLLSLDLPARAEPILQRLFDHAASPVQKAELGVRLAGLLADRGDAKGALAVLDASEDSALQSSLVTQRGLLRARLLAASGRQSDALGILSGVKGAPAIELQAKILEDRHAWAAAAKLLETLAGDASFSAQPDQAQRDIILRLANDESEAGDMAALRRLRAAQGARFASGPGAELFAVLTQEPIQAVDDLPRSGRELQAVRALPASLATH